MTREQIIEAMGKQYPGWTVEDISFMPWGAYIYAVRKDNPEKHWRFTIDF